MNRFPEITNCNELMNAIHQLGFLPLLESGIPGFNAEAMVAPDCRYVNLPDGGWEWQLWKWKGPAVTEGDCVYGKFFASKAGFISHEWWPHFFNWRRTVAKPIEPASIEETIFFTLREHGSMITRDLRRACGFVGAKMRSRFDSYITRLQMSCHIITEDFVYPRDRHGNEYGWGLALLTTPEQLLDPDLLQCSATPDESYRLIFNHMVELLPFASTAQINRLLKY
ncbi:MAG: hypothetical protein IJ835_06615 [Muribaculaceae bacterium]|nr:hypothetical protein [Muribaculaceae bacterium]